MASRTASVASDACARAAGEEKAIQATRHSVARLRFIRIMYLTDTELKCIRQSGFIVDNNRKPSISSCVVTMPDSFSVASSVCPFAGSAGSSKYTGILGDDVRGAKVSSRMLEGMAG